MYRLVLAGSLLVSMGLGDMEKGYILDTWVKKVVID